MSKLCRRLPLVMASVLLSMVGVVEVSSVGAIPRNVRVTPPVFASLQGGENVGCPVVNVSAVTRTVEIEARDLGGSIIDSMTSALAAGAGAQLTVSPTGQIYCRFTVVGVGSRTDIRGAISIGEGTRNFLSLPAE